MLFCFTIGIIVARATDSFQLEPPTYKVRREKLNQSQILKRILKLEFKVTKLKKEDLPDYYFSS